MLSQNLVFDERDPATRGLGYISCSLGGVPLPAYTAYDYFGWLLSVAARPRPDATSRNYYLPLLSCFANWCLEIAAHATQQSHAPAMVSIAVYEEHTVPAHGATLPWRRGLVKETHAFLGATIPDARAFQRDSNRATVVNHGRQLWMEECGLVPKDEGQRRGAAFLDPFQEPEKGFGRCAETFFWIFARERSLAQRWIHELKGVALVVRSQGEPTIPIRGYDEQAVVKALANPCNASCRYLAEQIDPGMLWGRDAWRLSFDKAHVCKGLW
ncbi:hypothetical protein PSPO01_08629 [Paraphaeosphaeria sporulosa]